MVPTLYTLLRLHIEAVWGVKLPTPLQSNVDVLTESVQPEWRLSAAQLTAERIFVWRPDVEASERERLRRRANRLLDNAPSFMPEEGVAYEIAHAFERPSLFDNRNITEIARTLTAEDYPLLEQFEAGSISYYQQQNKQPLLGVVKDGRLLTVAHSSRRTAEACELGIDTLPNARRKGYALAATLLWTWIVQQEGLVPLYSADAANTGSLRLAEAAGYQAFAHVFLLS